MAKEERLWICGNCALESDLEDEAIKIIRKGSRTALIIFDGQAHSLTSTSFEKLQRRRELQNKALAYSNYNLYQKDREETDEPPEESSWPIN